MKRQELPLISSCDDCGACCTGQAALPVSYYSVAPPSELAKLPLELRAELTEMRDSFMANDFPPDGSACVWYDHVAKRCRHYEHRPSICRDAVKVGDDACRRWRRSVGVDPTRRWSMKNGRVVKA